MLRGETEEVQRRMRDAMITKNGEEAIDEHFRYFDTICGATQDRQDALRDLLNRPMDLLLVVGGYNSSNTSHLAEMGEAKLPTYFIKDAEEMVSAAKLNHFLQDKHEMAVAENWLPTEGDLTLGVTAGASCPNNLIEEVILRAYELRGESTEPARLDPRLTDPGCPPTAQNSRPANATHSPPTRNSAPTPADATTPRNRPSGAPSFSATATGSSTRAPFADWSTRHRCSSAAAGSTCAHASPTRWRWPPSPGTSHAHCGLMRTSPRPSP